MRVLFIGNSATYMHDMPKTFARLSGADTDQLTKGGCTLSRYADEADELGIRAREMIREGYDLVFLQDNGNCISSPEMREKCVSACRTLDALIRESGAKTAIYIRPPYGYTAHGHTHGEQITAYMELFTGIAADLGCAFAPAAAAYGYMEEHHPGIIPLYHTDNAHTSPEGSLLVACLCMQAAGFALPEVIAGGNIPPATAQIIRNAAEAVFRQYVDTHDRGETPMPAFSYMDKELFPALSRTIFAILADNMEKIAPTGNTREADYASWYGAVSDGLQSDRRQIILIREGETLIGFFQYYVNPDTFMMEEIQFLPAWQKKGVFRALYAFVLANLPEIPASVEAYANKYNEKSIAVLRHLGLRIIGENKSGNSWHFRGSFADLLAWHGNAILREARAADAGALRQLYFEHLTKYPPKEEQDMARWEALIEKFAADENMYLLVAEADGTVVSTVQMAIVENLTHNLRPFAVIENVVTHGDHRCRGYASALLERASEIARQHGCYKISLETGSNRESTLNFYRRNGFEIDAKHACLKRL